MQPPYQGDAIYFAVLFADDELRVPIIRTLRFIRNDRRKDGTAVLLFRDADPNRSPETVAFNEANATEIVLDTAGLIDRLERSLSGKLATEKPD